MDIYEIRNALTSGRTIYDLPLRVTYYARVSTDKDEQLHSLSAQVSTIPILSSVAQTGHLLRGMWTKDSAAPV